MEQQRSLVFTAAVGLIILAIIVGSIYYLVKFIQGRVASNSQSPDVNVEQIAQEDTNPDGGSIQGLETDSPDSEGQSQTPPAAGNQNPAGKKVYNGGDFQFTYPDTWGVMKCDNSQNLELDPTNPADSSIACEIATKPVTVVVGDITGCEGETTKVGNVDVVRSQQSEDNYTRYQWCTKTTPVFNITHRVSQGNERATSKQDFSKQVEEMIANLSFSRGS